MAPGRAGARSHRLHRRGPRPRRRNLLRALRDAECRQGRARLLRQALQQLEGGGAAQVPHRRQERGRGQHGFGPERSRRAGGLRQRAAHRPGHRRRPEVMQVRHPRESRHGRTRGLPA
ncbi:hypothetical protein VARIO8X_60432 [Burkholderiales bacterium 8X]|nr:hypothetical protein VARIO8X_60432 [Burkholderiales bacterium 8X]